ncbi:MAG: VTT domain-containing protein, partial [Pseudomonadota bacterium]
ATVLVFGPVQGAAFSWISTLCSAFLTFFIGRVSGGAWVGRLGGERIRGVVAFLGRRGLAASALVRVVPSAPFIVVNAAAGAALIPIWKFAVGTAAGIVPKIALVAALGAAAPDGAVLQDGFAGLVAFFRSWTPAHVVAVAAIALAWAAAAALAHRLYADLRGRGGSL